MVPLYTNHPPATLRNVHGFANRLCQQRLALIDEAFCVVRSSREPITGCSVTAP